MLKARIQDGSGSGREALVNADQGLLVSQRWPTIPEFGTLSSLRFFSQLASSVGDGTGITNMNATISDSGTDGVMSDHTGPTYTFTSATGGLTGAVRINITDTGTGGNGIIGQYDVSSVTNDTTVELTEDVTNGTNETGLDWNIPSTISFFINSNDNYDIRIMALVIFIGDTAVVHSSFGNVNALTNGWDLDVVEGGVATSIIDSATTGGEVIIQSASSLAWGDAATSFELTNYSGTQDATVVVFPMGDFIPHGLRIGRGTTDHVRSVVNDDLTGLNDFTVRALGYRQYP